MKYCIVFAIIVLNSCILHADYAWFSSEINAILVSPEFPKKYRTLESPVVLYGSFDKNNWIPPHAKVSYVTGDITIENDSKITVDTFVDLNNYGKYDPNVSLGHYVDNCKLYLTDEFGQQYPFFDENVASFYSKYESMNMNAAVIAFDQLKTKFQLWISSIRLQTSDLTYDARSLSEKVKEIDAALDNASKSIEETISGVKDRVEYFNNSIEEAREHLANVANESVLEAQDLINGCVSDFSSFIDILKDSLESGSGWKEGAENAYNKITESEQKILDAIEKLMPYDSDSDVHSALVVLELQKNTIQGLKTGLRSAIDNNDKGSAEGILASAESAGIINAKKAMKRIENAEKTYKSQQLALNTLQKAAVGTIDYVNMIEDEIESLRENFNNFVMSTMDNFHEIGSYLCSTNSMEYLAWRKTNKSISDMTDDEVKRWFSITMQEPLFRDSEDKDTYETIGKLGMFEGGTYNTIFRLIGSTYFLTYMDLSWLDRFVQTYDQGSFKKQNIRGFYEEVESEGANTVTNWYAGHISAPKNWADGTSIIVTNGVYKNVSNLGQFPVEVTYNGETKIVKVLGGAICIGRKYYEVATSLTISSTTENVRLCVNVNNNTVTIEEGDGFTDPMGNLSYIPLYKFSNKRVVRDYRGAPSVQKWE